MSGYFIRRLISAVPVLLVVATITFLVIRVLPGDLAELRLGQQANPQGVHDLRRELGLDRPIAGQYMDWLTSAVTGDFGESATSGTPVTRQFGHALPVTVELSLLSILGALVVGVPLGVASAYRSQSPLDYAIRLVSSLGQSMPSFWIAILALTFLSIYASWTPPFTYHSLWSRPLDNLEQVMLPVLILGWLLASVIIRVVRSATLDVLREDFVRTARAKGVGERQVLSGHVIRHTMIPVVTVVGIQLGALISGAVLLEQIFAIPGVGNLTLQSLLLRDYQQLQFNVLMLAVVVVVLNICVDCSYVLFDPRIRIRALS